MAASEKALSLALTAHFRDAAGLAWIRDERGRLSRHKPGNLTADALGGSLVKGRAEATEHPVDVAPESEGVEVPTVAYTTHTMSGASGNQLTINLAPRGLGLEVEATGSLTLNGELRATAEFGNHEHLLALTFHNVNRHRSSATQFRMEHLSVYDQLLLVFFSGELADGLETVTEMITIPSPGGGQVGEVLYDAAKALVLVRIADASRRLHPEFWRRAGRAPTLPEP
jgi:hypothetical protein